MTNESKNLPPIFKVTQSLLEFSESNEDRFWYSKSVLTKKLNYSRQLRDYESNFDLSACSKQSKLDALKYHVEASVSKNLQIRNRAQDVYDLCGRAYEDLNNLELAFMESKDKPENIGKVLHIDNIRYEKQMDELIKSLEELTEKRKKQLSVYESQIEKYTEENEKLKFETTLSETDDDVNLELFEDELKELRNKLKILNDENVQLNDEYKNLTTGEVTEDYGPDKDGIIKKYEEINLENENINENIISKEHHNVDLTNSLQMLEAMEIKLNESMDGVSKLWEILDRNGENGFHKFQEEMENIKSEIAERKERYCTVENENVMLIEAIKEHNEEIETSKSTVETLVANMKEVLEEYNNLKNNNNLPRIYENILGELNELKQEKDNLGKLSAEKEANIKENLEHFQKEKDKGELEILALQNKNLLEIETLSEANREVELNKNVLEEKIESVESETKIWESKKENLKDAKANLEKKHKTFVKDQAIAQNQIKMYLAKKEEMKKKLAPSVPPPIYVKRNEQSFSRPKTPEGGKRAQKNQDPKRSRNWDSDSSMEVEEITLDELLKKKHMRMRRSE